MKHRARNRAVASYDLKCLAVYVPNADGTGTRCIGFIFPRNKSGFEGFDAADKSLGIFPTAKEAADAISVEAKTVEPSCDPLWPESHGGQS